MNKKKLVLCILIALVCVVLVVVGTLLSKPKQVIIKASDGKEIAKVSMDKGNIAFDCDEDKLIFVNTAWEEAVEIVMLEEGCNKEQAEKSIIDSKMIIETTFNQELNDNLYIVCQSNRDKVNNGYCAEITDINGKILALYSYQKDGTATNYVLAPTYAGSTMKPLSVYGPAIEAGTINWSTEIMDEPYKVINNEDGTSKEWPQNTEPYTYEDWMVCDGLSRSLNTIAVKVLSQYGVEKSCDFLENSLGLDIESERELISTGGEDEVLANIALGYLRKGITIKQLAGYYQIFANGGNYTEPYCVSSIYKSEKEYYKNKSESKRVFSEETAYICNRLLNRVVTEKGTAPGAAVPGIDVCGKTGTSDKDNWFVGITPQYVCAVWFDAPEEICVDKKLSVETFNQIISSVDIDKSIEYPVCSDVVELEICGACGGIAEANSNKKEVGYFRQDNIPPKCSCK